MSYLEMILYATCVFFIYKSTKKSEIIKELKKEIQELRYPNSNWL